MPPVTAWVSPHDPYETVADVLADLDQLRATLPGREIRVAMPTAYGPYLQGKMERPAYRALGDPLCPATLDDLARLRDTFAAAGFPCDGWCVPRGNTGNARIEGQVHGQTASLFERFYLNTEWGWPGFWTRPGSVAAIEAYLAGLWDALQRAGASPALGWTMVCNSMLDGSTDDELRAWAGGCHLVALETYLPRDPGLDPHKGLAKWQARAEAAGISQPATVMLEKGNLTRYIARLSDPDHGAHLWTLASTRAYFATLPRAESAVADEPTPDVAGLVDEAEPDPDPAWLAKKALVVNTLGLIAGDLANAVRGATNKAARCQVADELERIAREALAA